MKAQISLISGFILLNLALGRLFHESLNLVCFSELIAIAITNFVFWVVIAKQLKKRINSYNHQKSTQTFFKHGVIGLLTTLTTILISQGLIILLMVYVYKCTSPSFSFINASLTNNAAINLLCYFTLVYSFFQTNKTAKDVLDNRELQPANFSNKQLLLSSGNKQHLILFKDIRYIEASNNCIIINSSKGKFVKYQSLKSFLIEHKQSYFKRVHRSYAVNIEHIDSIEKNKNGDGFITLKNKETVKLSRNYKLDCFNKSPLTIK